MNYDFISKDYNIINTRNYNCTPEKIMQGLGYINL